MVTRADTFALLKEYTKSESLIKHGLAVEAAMAWYATEHFGLSGEALEHWKICGLIHDFDYEQFPEPTPPNGHPFKGNQILESLGYPEEIRTAIMGHAVYTGVPRETDMAKTLFAVDELSGLITACVLVRPDCSIYSLKPKSVKKKLKDKGFARGCSRDDIRLGCEELGLQLDDHIQNVILALTKSAVELDIEGSGTQPTAIS